MKLTILERPTALTAQDFAARLDHELKELKGELNVSTTLEGFSPNGWAQVNITGEDTEIMSELITNKFAIAHRELREIESQGDYGAEIIGPNAKGLRFDLGIDTRNLDCLIPSSNLNAQLADGKALPLRQVVENYCLYSGMRVGVRVQDKSNHVLEAWLSDGFVDTIRDWVALGLDRIQVFECFRKEAELAVLKEHLTRDVVRIDSTTLTIQSIVCKLGTDAVGLIPKLGRILRKQPLKPFQPKKITSRCRPW